ncbi:MAG: hypothetical protein FWG21_00085 [Oscillospiraceae bacterium]|nr:hypothetical protein [Oscillospiraceae bacterium]
MKQFPSKRNIVYLQDNHVHKQHTVISTLETERVFLHQLKENGVKVPMILDICSNTLVTEYITGQTIPDFLEQSVTATDCNAVAENLICWLKHFYCAVAYTSTHEIRGDINGRNFIITSDLEIYGVDFENHEYGSIEEDLGRLLAYIDSYYLEDNSAAVMLHSSVLEHAISTFAVDIDDIMSAKQTELAAMQQRRSDRISREEL